MDEPTRERLTCFWNKRQDGRSGNPLGQTQADWRMRDNTQHGGNIGRGPERRRLILRALDSTWKTRTEDVTLPITRTQIRGTITTVESRPLMLIRGQGSTIFDMCLDRGAAGTLTLDSLINTESTILTPTWQKYRHGILLMEKTSRKQVCQLIQRLGFRIVNYTTLCTHPQTTNCRQRDGGPYLHLGLFSPRNEAEHQDLVFFTVNEGGAEILTSISLEDDWKTHSKSKGFQLLYNDIGMYWLQSYFPGRRIQATANDIKRLSRTLSVLGYNPNIVPLAFAEIIG